MAVSVWILGDQLLLNHPALAQAEEGVDRNQIIVLITESQTRARRLPYQRKKLVLLFSAMRHYAEKLHSSGYQVDYRLATTTTSAIREHLRKHQPEAIITMEASAYGGRKYQKNLANLFDIPIIILSNTQFLTGRYNPVPDPEPSKRYVQEQFYRKMRQHFELMMEPNGKPIGGKWNFDKSNRRSLPKNTQPILPISFEPDQITLSVMREVDQEYQGIGQVFGFDLAVTHEEAHLAASDFFEHRLSNFGTYEDAMSSAHDTIFHSRLSPYLNLGLLDPLALAQEAQKRYLDGQAPINSVEGFIRQVVGWREFIYWQYWRLMPEIARSDYWQADRPLPEMFWTGETRMNCMSHVINRAVQSGYTHHIERLMIISNFCLLAGIEPSAVNDWFLSAYIDAYEWVMIPNVFGMGLYADFDHKLRTGAHACPFNYLYWNFVLEHEETLRSNTRMSRSLLGLKRFDLEQKQLIRKNAEEFLEHL